MVRETTRLEAKNIISQRIDKIFLDDYYRHLRGGSFALISENRPDLMKKKKREREINLSRSHGHVFKSSGEFVCVLDLSVMGE